MKRLLILLLFPLMMFSQDTTLKYFICGLNITTNDDKLLFEIRKGSVLNGKIKSRKLNQKLQEGDFICYISNINNVILDSLYIGNPLNPKYEYNSDIDKLHYHNVNSNEADVVLKFNYAHYMKYLSIYRFTNKKRVLQISNLKLL